jgi:16S rRNA (cytosine967-C5)-methyltransferase
MTPAARLQAAIDVLTELEQTALPADRVLREYFRARRYAGSKDRAAVAERVFDCLRHYYSYGWTMNGSAPRRLVLASLIVDTTHPDEFFTGAPYAPAPLTDEERATVETNRQGPPPYAWGDYPEWLDGELERAFGAQRMTEMYAQKTRAPVDIRVNTVKTTREALTAALAAEGYDAKPAPLAETGLRLDGDKTAKLSASPLFAAGHFEFQDAAAQMAAQLCDAKPGMRVLDYAAGGGGKALALAAAMQNKGTILAHDISDKRLAMIGPRAERAGVTIIQPGKPSGLFDLVLLDAPCSGTGTWRRQPELRVRLTPERLQSLVALQSELLEKCVPFVKPGGRLVYATCSVLPCENDDRIAAFLGRHREFSADPETFFRASPYRTQTDGFFTAILHRTS